MKAKRKKILIFLLILVFIAFLTVFIARYLIHVRVRLEIIQAELAYEKKQREELQSQLQKKTEDLEAANNQLNVVSQKLTILEKDNDQLLKVKHYLENKILTLEKEKQDFEQKLHSLPELKKFIRQVKKEIHEQKIKEYLGKIQLQKEIDAQKLKIGNRGFFIKEGKTTYKPTIIIEVKPGS